MEVTLDVFSGRPNPSWTLSPDEEADLARRLSGLPPSEAPPAAEDLGYRGFTLSGAPVLEGMASDIRIANGVVTVSGEDVRHLVDVAGIEHWLADQARQRGYALLVEGR